MTRLHWAGLMVLGLFGCDDKGGEELVDNDGDGAIADIDCDDDDASVFPGAEELCDGIDNNCDDAIDEDASDASILYVDADGDGYGIGGGVALCEAASGYVANADDCDDSSAEAFPGGAELCDGRDNDCNGTIDDGAGDIVTFYSDLDGDGYGNPKNTKDACAAPDGFVGNGDDCDDSDASLSPETRWYPDADGDGFGSPVNFVEGCDQPSTYVDNADDCLDEDDSVYPGQVAEDPKLCMIDTDYDGFGDAYPPPGVDAGTDCDDSDLYTFPGAAAEDPKLCMSDNDSDGYGDAYPADGVDAGTDCDDDSAATYPGAVPEDKSLCMADSDGDGYGDASPPDGVDAGTDCDDDDAAQYPGATEVCNYEDDDCNGRRDDDASDATTYYVDDDGDTYGVSTSTVTACTQPVNGATASGDCDDTDGDVYPNAPEDCTDGIDNNCNGSIDEVCTYGLDDADVSISGGTNTYDYLGLSMEGGDITGDGYDDVLIGAYGADPSGYYTAGQVFVLEGPMTSGASMDVRTDSAVTISGSASSTYLGYRLNVGDIDGDGYDDLVANGYYNNSGRGSSFVYYGPMTSASYSSSGADATISGANTYDYFGYTFSELMDIDDDGLMEVVGGAYGYDPSGYTSGGILAGFENPTGSLSVTAGDWTVTGTATYDYIGYSGAQGDLNDDGVTDLIFGSPYYNEESYIVNGPISGAMTRASADVTISHWTTYDYTGSIVAVGDLDGDGSDDLIMSSQYDDIGNTYTGNSNYSMGAAYIFYGPVTSDMTDSTDADAILYGTESYTYFGYAHYGNFDMVDMDGDGKEELIAGNGYDPFGASYAGALYIFEGPITGAQSLASYSAAVVNTASSQYFARQVGQGDIDDDGTPDLLAGSMYANSYYGGGYVFFGSNF